MSFKCQITGKISKSGEKCNKIVTKKRDRVYTKWVANEETRQWEEVVAGHGWEVVKEINVSNEGLALWQQMLNGELSPEDFPAEIF